MLIPARKAGSLVPDDGNPGADTETASTRIGGSSEINSCRLALRPNRITSTLSNALRFDGQATRLLRFPYENLVQ